jgi:phosphate acetyltransferase
MAKSIYLAAVEGHTIKSAIALGVLEALKTKHKRVGVFRAVTRDAETEDYVLRLLISNSNIELNYEDSIGVAYQDVHTSPEKALKKIVARFKKLESEMDAMLVIGSDYNDVVGPTELNFNARIATNIGLPVMLVVNGLRPYETSEHLGQGEFRKLAEIQQIIDLSGEEFENEFAQVSSVIVNRMDPELISSTSKLSTPNNVPAWGVAEDQFLVAPRMKTIMENLGGKLIFGDESRLQNEATDVVIASMNAVNVLPRLKENAVVVTPADRTDTLLALITADRADNFPQLAGIVLNGGFDLPQEFIELISGLNPTIPVIAVESGTFDTTIRVTKTRGKISQGDSQKLAHAKRLFENHVDSKDLLQSIQDANPTAQTPLLFEHSLMQRAARVDKTIVLPEGDDSRVLQAAHEILAGGIAKLIILGNPRDIKKQAKQLGLNLDGAELMEIPKSKHFEAAAQEYFKLRSHKGITLEQARETVADASYFGTMLVHLGVADGMVSGASNTTAHTIKPSFEIIKTKPNVSSVSSVFLMALADRVLVYGDCAVIPEPTTEQLADIAISSAETAIQFDIEPKVAMLSYSTGASGFGAEVERVREATQIARSRKPELSIEGPIQYDAAVDAAVASKKLPESQVAGNATVFIFPDLNTGNNTYKAVQRTAGAVAIGPVLQGLNKPVNDLSRGALVGDIVNTIAITAIQAQG